MQLNSIASDLPSATVSPSATAPATDSPVKRGPSTLTVPSLEDGSAAASASLDQVASYLGLLTEDGGEYEERLKRGFLESAIEYAKFAGNVLDYDESVDNDGFQGIIEGAVLQSLYAAKSVGVPPSFSQSLFDELAMAQAAATNAARGLEAMVAGTR